MAGRRNPGTGWEVGWAVGSPPPQSPPARRSVSRGRVRVGSGCPPGSRRCWSLEGGGDRAPEPPPRALLGASNPGAHRQVAGVHRELLRSRRLRYAPSPGAGEGSPVRSWPGLALPDPGGPSVRSRAGGRKGAAEPAARSVGLGSAVLPARLETPSATPKQPGLLPITCGGARSWRCLARNFYLPPPSAFSRRGLHSAGGSPSPRDPPPKPLALPVSTGPPNLSSPLRVPCTAGGGKLVRKEINSPVTTYTHSRTRTHAHSGCDSR